MGEVVSYTKTGIEALIAESIVSAGGATQGDIDAAIAALIDTSPTTLDTLNELAAALGDDANFAASVTTRLAGSMGVVIHGATAGAARPAGYGAIHWIGSVTPTNAIDNDVWTDTSA